LERRLYHHNKQAKAQVREKTKEIKVLKEIVGIAQEKQTLRSTIADILNNRVNMENAAKLMSRLATVRKEEEELRAAAEPVVEYINSELAAANKRFNLKGKDAHMLLPPVDWRSRDVLEAQRQLRVLKSSERYWVTMQLEKLRDKELAEAQDRVAQLEKQVEDLTEDLVEEKKKHAAILANATDVEKGGDVGASMLQHYIKLQNASVEMYLSLGISSEDLAEVVATFQTIMSKAWYDLDEEEIQTLQQLHKSALDRSNARKVLEAYERLQRAWQLKPDMVDSMRDEDLSRIGKATPYDPAELVAIFDGRVDQINQEVRAKEEAYQRAKEEQDRRMQEALQGGREEFVGVVRGAARMKKLQEMYARNRRGSEEASTSEPRRVTFKEASSAEDTPTHTSLSRRNSLHSDQGGVDINNDLVRETLDKLVCIGEDSRETVAEFQLIEEEMHSRTEHLLAEQMERFERQRRRDERVQRKFEENKLRQLSMMSRAGSLNEAEVTLDIQDYNTSDEET